MKLELPPEWIFHGRNDWSPEHVRRYWEWVSSNPYLHKIYFSRQVAGQLATILDAAGLLNGKILDYGCGPGYFVKYLADMKMDVMGADFSSESIDSHHSRGDTRHLNLININNLSTVPDESFHLITCNEVIEHLNDELLDQTLKTFHRLLKPDGCVMITVPMDEDMMAGLVCCPFCQSYFSRAQHLRSFTPQSIRQLLAEYGMSEILVKDLDINALPRFRNISLRDRVLWALKGRPFLTRPGLNTIRKAPPGPHLITIARKTGSVQLREAK
jgi:2-polyprenyl-3-methyl-5-hydroxy-6-metoxy-1,4-benzoquinol methylase